MDKEILLWLKYKPVWENTKHADHCLFFYAPGSSGRVHIVFDRPAQSVTNRLTDAPMLLYAVLGRRKIRVKLKVCCKVCDLLV